MNAITKDFTDAIEAQFGKLNKDVQDALQASGAAKGIVLEMEQKEDGALQNLRRRHSRVRKLGRAVRRRT